MDDFKRY